MIFSVYLRSSGFLVELNMQNTSIGMFLSPGYMRRDIGLRGGLLPDCLLYPSPALSSWQKPPWLVIARPDQRQGSAVVQTRAARVVRIPQAMHAAALFVLLTFAL